LVVPGGLWSIPGDVTQLQQVLLNLCVNARDAMPKGGRLRVEAENLVLDGSQYVRIRVADTGHGMSPEVQRKIFDPFYTTKSNGNGIGLSTVASIVKRHGGTIELDTAPGLGTEFRVLLAVTPQPSQPKPAPDPTTGRGSVLLVIDEGSIREIIRGTLA